MAKFQRYSTSLLALALALPLPTAFGALAQTKQQASGVEEIVVTARKREEVLRDVPASISTLRGLNLQVATSGGADLTFLSARVPSVVVESSFGRTFPRFYIRGLGNTDFDLNASQPVSIVFDDVVFENPVLKGFPTFDLAGIDVLRGPQGTLFGRNTPGGVVKFDSVKPSSDFGGYVKAGARTLEGFDLEGAVGGEIAKGLSARASGLFQRQGDWISNLYTNQKDVMGGYTEYAGRLQFRYQPDDKLDALLNVHGRDADTFAQFFRANIIQKGTNRFVPGFNPRYVYYDGGANNPQTLKSYGLAANVKYDFGPVQLTSVTGYEHLTGFSRGDIDGGYGCGFCGIPNGPGFVPFSSESADGVDGLDQVSQEIRLSNDANQKLSWQVGAYYFNEDVTISSFSYDSLAKGAVNGRAIQNQKTDSYAVFGTVTYKLTDAWNATGGLRYTDDSRDWTGTRFVGPIGNGAGGPYFQSVGDSAVSWDLSTVYQLTKETNLYARVARGFRAPSIQGRLMFAFGPNPQTTAKSEFVTSYEAGVKATTADRRARIDLSGFYYDIDDQQLTAIGGAGNNTILLNAKKGVGYGLEAEGEYRPIENLSIMGSVSYNHTEIKDPTLAVAVCGSGCTVLNKLDKNGNALINGNGFPNSPNWIADLSLRYSVPLANGAEVYGITDWAFKGKTNFFLYKSVEYSSDGYWDGGIRFAYVLPGAKTEIGVYGRNITDQVKLVGGIDFNNLTGFINPPRLWGVDVKYRF